MRAARFYGVGKPFVVEQVDRPGVDSKEVLVKVKACGVCHTDTLFLGGFKKPGKLPITLGHEIAGEIDAIGKEVNNVIPGDRVVVYFYLSCGVCDFCRAGRESLCACGRVGFDFDGGYSDFVKVPAKNVLPLPKGLAYVDGAVLTDAAASTLHAVSDVANVRIGEKVAVLGTGGLGSFAVQWALLSGAQVVAIDVDDSKLKMASQLGANATINSQRDDVAQRVRELFGRGADVVLEFVGTEQSMHDAMRIVARGGRLITVGYSGEPVAINPATMVAEQLSILGSRANTRLELEKAIEAAAKGLIRSTVTKVFGLESINTAFDELMKGRTVGRSVIQP